MSTTEASLAIFPTSLDGSAFINAPVLRPTRSLIRRMKLILILLLVGTILAASALVGFYAYILYRLQKPPVPNLGSNPWKAIGLTYSDVEFPSANGKTRVDGWYIPGASRNTVILSHGYGGNREEPWIPLYQIAKVLHNNRFNVLMFDYSFVRPEHYVTGGIQESSELRGAISLVKELGDEQIYIWGFSMGAGTALQTALVDSHDINGMILDSTFIMDSDAVYQNVKQKLNRLPRFPSVFMLNLLSPIYTGYSIKQVPINQVKSTKYQMPLFLVHGEQDKVAPIASVVSFYEEQKDYPGTELWMIPDGQHEFIYKYHQEEYMKRAIKFLYDSVHQANLSKSQKLLSV
ncbi:alpha/beta hydrolase [Gorillibacterium timonense]|uniref:alpha/beta hydrolase n=1 Tax=Gorillibacterium timonense TaxID=1689269 RepID=UPI00071DF15E|nr:alpha/beta hydrolase [Gorillibacterium timonense]